MAPRHAFCGACLALESSPSFKMLPPRLHFLCYCLVYLCCAADTVPQSSSESITSWFTKRLKCHHFKQTLEFCAPVSDFFVSNDVTRPRTLWCFTLADESNTIHLKIVSPTKDPPPVLEHHVPMFLTDKELYDSSQWDLTTQQVSKRMTTYCQ